MGKGRPTAHALNVLQALGTSDRFWVNPQSRDDLDVSAARHHEEFDRIRPLLPAWPRTKPGEFGGSGPACRPALAELARKQKKPAMKMHG